MSAPGSVRIGIAVASDRIRAVAVKGERIIAATEAERAPGDTLAAAVAELLSAAPLPRFPRPRVVAALGPSLSQTRRISGLPPLTDRRVLAQLVREGAGKFFLVNGTPLATTGVRLEEPGTVWAAALDERAVREVESGCRTAGLVLDAAVPAAVVLPRALRGERLVWRDGAAAAEVRAEGGALVSVRRAPAALAFDSDAPTPVAALAELGEHAWRFADAYGAAVLPATEPLVLRPGREGAASGSVPRWRLVAAGTALALAALAALVGPTIRAMQAEDEAVAQLALLQRQRTAAAETDRELRRVTAALAEVAAFDAARHSPTLLLADLTAALPRGTAMVSFKADTAGGNLVALTPRAAAVLTPLEKVPGIAAPEIVGPVTRENVGGRELERVTIRFRLDTRSRAGRSGRPDGEEGAP